MKNNINWVPIQGRKPRLSPNDNVKRYTNYSDRLLVWVIGYGARFGSYHLVLKKFFVEGLSQVDQTHITHWSYINEP